MLWRRWSWLLTLYYSTRKSAPGSAKSQYLRLVLPTSCTYLCIVNKVVVCTARPFHFSHKVEVLSLSSLWTALLRTTDTQPVFVTPIRSVKNEPKLWSTFFCEQELMCQYFLNIGLLFIYFDLMLVDGLQLSEEETADDAETSEWQPMAHDWNKAVLI